MNLAKVIGVVLIAAGAVGLVMGSFSYTKESDAVKLGPLELSVKQKETINVPVWAGIGAIAVGVVLLVMGGRKGEGGAPVPFAGLMAAWLVAWVGTAQADSTAYEARVMRVFDADTVWVQTVGGGRWRKLRFDGIDAPEICQPGGLAARDALAARVLGDTVQVVERAADDYGRGIALLNHRGEDIGRWLVQGGQAWAHRWRGRGPYVGAEDEARRARRGVFDDGQAELPRDFRRRHGPCVNPPRGLSAVR